MIELGRVLVVDDAPYIRDILDEYLRDLGYTVATAPDGETALHMLKTGRPDVVLLDLWMPGMDGVDVITAIRLADPTLPVVILTADTDIARAQQLLTRGAFDYIPKPFDFDVVGRIVAVATASRSAPSRQEASSS